MSKICALEDTVRQLPTAECHLLEAEVEEHAPIERDAVDVDTVDFAIRKEEMIPDAGNVSGARLSPENLPASLVSF